MHKFFLILTIISMNTWAQQFAPPAGSPGSTAIHRDSNVIISWLNTPEISRGWVNISDTSLGKVTYGQNEDASGMADGLVISLGDGGEAIYTLNTPISDASGYDFAVFENAFDSVFLELAVVSVSSDGIHFQEFPSVSLSDTVEQIGGFEQINCRNIHNLAGKYIVNFGTPFDLSTLPENTFVNTNQIKYIKIKDVVGSLNNEFVTRDSQGNKINDPFPTPFPSGGFDLDAVALLSMSLTIPVSHFEAYEIHQGSIENKSDEWLEIFNLLGKRITLISPYGVWQKPTFLSSNIFIMKSSRGKTAKIRL
ncbi:MAG: T9SS C-terminal target domain-containing protein [Flavobacteriales bacterium]|nr:T9SS C-terminal target domain-containing protein [Flavobacteriales bacterium]